MDGKRPIQQYDLTSDGEALAGKILAETRRQCPGWLSSQIDDIAQTAYADLLNHLWSHNECESFKSSYVAKVVHSAVVNAIRQAQRRKENLLGDGEPPASDAAVSSSNPERWMMAKELVALVRRSLAHLLGPRRRAVRSYLAGMSIHAVAARFGWTDKKAENLIYRGLADLRKRLRKKGVHP